MNTPDQETPQSDPAQEQPNPQANEAKQGPAPTGATFLQFLSGMGMQTLMQLGLMSNPMTNERNVDLVQARYSIDLLGVLEEKTRGNRTDEEEEYLQTMLAQLRMGYVDALGRKDGEAGSDTANDGDGGAPAGDAGETTDNAPE